MFTYGILLMKYLKIIILMGYLGLFQLVRYEGIAVQNRPAKAPLSMRSGRETGASEWGVELRP